MHAKVVLRTPRLLLRRARPDDLAAFHAMLSDPETMRFWSTEPHASLERTREWLDGMIASPPAESEDFVVEFAGRTIGKAGAYRLPHVGYALDRAYWGRGLAREAMSATIDYVFETRGVRRLEADVDPANMRSIRLLERLGFDESGRAEKTWFIGGRWHDSVYYTLEHQRFRP